MVFVTINGLIIRHMSQAAEGLSHSSCRRQCYLSECGQMLKDPRVTFTLFALLSKWSLTALFPRGVTLQAATACFGPHSRIGKKGGEGERRMGWDAVFGFSSIKIAWRVSASANVSASKAASHRVRLYATTYKATRLHLDRRLTGSGSEMI